VADTLNAYDNTEGRTPIVVVYDARGNGGGGGDANDHRRPSRQNN